MYVCNYVYAKQRERLLQTLFEEAEQPANKESRQGKIDNFNQALSQHQEMLLLEGKFNNNQDEELLRGYLKLLSTFGIFD